jgi:hypothetical protein
MNIPADEDSGILEYLNYQNDRISEYMTSGTINGSELNGQFSLETNQKEIQAIFECLTHIH